MTNEQLEEALWAQVPEQAIRLAKLAAGPCQVMSDLMYDLPPLEAKIWYNPDRERVLIEARNQERDSEKIASYHIAFKQVPGVESIAYSRPNDDEPYILVKQAVLAKDVFQPVQSALQMEPNAVNKLVGGPSPLASMLAGGLLGAGVGYGGGWLAEQFLPAEHFEEGKLRRTGALAGAGIGALPGAWWTSINHRNDPSLSTHTGFKKLLGALTSGYPITEKTSAFTPIREGLTRLLPEGAELNELWSKAADETGSDFLPMIPVDQFGRAVWNDLNSYGGYTSPQLAAATTGLVQAASQANGGIRTISPYDIARISIGMGSGYQSGTLVGRALGALAGLRPESQKKLQESGVWAGFLSNVVPMAFGQ